MHLRIWFALLSIGLAPTAFSQLSEPHFQETYQPHTSVEQAIVSARKALARHDFDPSRFEIRSVSYQEEIGTEEELKALEEMATYDKSAAQTKAMIKEFGMGPTWQVEFWRTRQVRGTGDHFDDLSLALIVRVYPNNRVALLDRRWFTPAEDKLKRSDGSQ